MLAPLFAEIPFNRQVFGVDTGRAEDNFIFLGTDLVKPGVGLLPEKTSTTRCATGSTSIDDSS